MEYNCFENLFANIKKLERKVLELEDLHRADQIQLQALNVAKDNLVHLQDMEEP